MKASLPRSGYFLTDPPSLTSLAAEAIRGRIVAGELAPGQRLVEETLASELGISRPPVRESLRTLAGEGLVRLIPRRGAVVTSFTLQDVFEIVTLREALEGTAIELALPSPSGVALDELRAALVTLERHADEGREDMAVPDSARLHQAMVALAGNGRLSAAYLALSHQLQILMRMNRAARRGSESLQFRAARHRDLVTAIEAGDRAGAREALHDGSSLTFLAEPAIDLTIGDERAQRWLRQIRAAAG